MFQIQSRRGFHEERYSVIADDFGVVAVVRKERYTKLLARAPDLRAQLLVATILLERVAPNVDLTEMNEVLQETLT